MHSSAVKLDTHYRKKVKNCVLEAGL